MRRVDDLVAVHLAATALGLVLRAQRELADARRCSRICMTIVGAQARPPQDLTVRRSGLGASGPRLSQQPADDVEHVDLRERLEVGLGALGVLVRAEPERLARSSSRARAAPRRPRRAGRRRRACSRAPRRAPRARARRSAGRASACRPPRRRRRSRAARRGPSARGRGGAASPGRRRSRRAPSLSPRARSDSSSACVFAASLRAGPRRVLGLEEAAERPRRRPPRRTRASSARISPGYSISSTCPASRRAARSARGSAVDASTPASSPRPIAARPARWPAVDAAPVVARRIASACRPSRRGPPRTPRGYGYRARGPEDPLGRRSRLAPVTIARPLRLPRRRDRAVRPRRARR